MAGNIRVNCRHLSCDGNVTGPELRENKRMPGWKYNVYTCEKCGSSHEILVMINGKTGKAGEELNEFERDTIGAVRQIPSSSS